MKLAKPLGSNSCRECFLVEQVDAQDGSGSRSLLEFMLDPKNKGMNLRLTVRKGGCAEQHSC